MRAARLASACSVMTAAPVSTGMLAVRTYVNTPTPLVAFAGIIQLAIGDHAQYAGVYGDTDGHWAVTEHSSAGLIDHHSTRPTPMQTWVCVELDYDLDARHATLYIDSNVVLDVDMTDPAPMFTETDIGVTRATTAGFRVFADDIVIATSHIGC